MEGQLSQRTMTRPQQEQERPAESLEDRYQNVPRGKTMSFLLPAWYEEAYFRYSRRVIFGLIPGAILLGLTEGANIFAAIAVSVLIVTLVHQGGGLWLAVVLALVSFFLVIAVSIYSVAPLIWRSVLNYPIGFIAHLILLVSASWCLLLLKAFRLYDPSVVVILEQVVMGTMPVVVILPVVWQHLMLFPARFLPHSLTLFWFVALGLYVVPLQSSFAKRNTPKDEALILHRYLAWAHLALFVVVPPALEWFLGAHSSWIDSVLSLVLFLCLPTFLLTLLESQGMMSWTGLQKHLVPYVRRTFGALALACVSLLLYRGNQSEMLLLACPMAVIQFLAVTSSESDQESVVLPRQAIAATSVLLAYVGAFIRLPWGLSFHFSGPLMLSLDLVQVILLIMAINSVFLFVFWRRFSSAAAWVPYLAAFAFCEHLLIRYDVYHPLLMIATSILGTALMYRLWVVRRVGRNASWLCVSLLLTKLTQLLLVRETPLPQAALAHLAVLFVFTAGLRMAVYQSHATLKPSHLMFFAMMLSVGLLVAAPTLLSPLWLATTHSQLPVSVIAAFSLIAVSLYVIYAGRFLKKSPPQWLSQLPLAIVGLAVILAILQPEMSLEMVHASVILYIHYFMEGSAVHGMDVQGGLVAAWTAMLEWCVVLSLISTAVAVLQKSYRWLSTLCASFLGAFVGALVATWLLHQPPTTAYAVEYAVVCSLTAIITCRAVTSTRAGSYLDTLMFFLQLVVFVANLSSELYHIDSIQEEEPDEKWAVPPTTRLHFGVFLVIAATFKIKQFQLQSSDQSPSQTYMALSGNVACCLVYVLALVNPLHLQPVVSILISSLVFLFLQEDGTLVRISLANFPLSPCVMVAVITLYIFDISHLYSFMSEIIRFSLARAAVYYGELALLLLGIPGHFLVIWYLWTGRGSVFHLKIWMILALFVPNSILAYCSSSPYSLTLAGIAVTGLALTSAQQTK